MEAEILETDPEVEDALAAPNTAAVPVNTLEVEEMLAQIMEPPLPDEQVSALQGELNPGDIETEHCPKCGEAMLAEADPTSLLSFPMRYLWRCEACGHEETRLDRHVESNPSADAAMAYEGREPSGDKTSSK